MSDEVPELDVPELTAAPAEIELPGWRKVADTRIAVFGILFGVTGCLGLPLLFASRSFSTTEKWVWAVINVIYTVAFVTAVGWVILWSWGRISAVI